MPKLKILQDKGNVTFNKNNNERKRFLLLNFPCTAILDFYDITVLPLLLES